MEILAYVLACFDLLVAALFVRNAVVYYKFRPVLRWKEIMITNIVFAVLLVAVSVWVLLVA